MSLQVWLPLNGNTSNQGLNGLSMIGSPNSWGDGKIGKCATFNGNLIYNDTTELNYTDNFSYCLWINQNYSGAVAEYAFTVGRADIGGYGYGINILSASIIRLWFGSRSIDISCPANEWHHIALTVSGNIIKVYKDGVLLTTSTTQTLPTYSDGKGLGLGYFHYSAGDIYPYHGSLNDFRIYNHCLSAKEVKEISKGLICHYLMNQPEQSPNLSTLPSCIPDFPNGAGTSVFSRSTDGVSRRLTCTTSGTGGVYNSCFSNSERLENTTYTWSVDIRASKSMPVSIGLEGGGEVNVTLTTDWQRMSKTAVLLTDTYSAFIIYPHANAAVGDWIEVKLLKVEKNNFATSWSPCSSDYPKWSDNTEYDCSGYRNDGTRIGGISLSNSPTSIRYESHYSFDGDTGCIQIPNLSTLVPSGEFTMNCWIYHDDTWSSKEYETIFGGPSGFELEAKNKAANSPVLYAHSWGKVAATYELNKWNMITMTRNASEAKFYINGELKVTGSAGTIPSGNYFVGAWDTSSKQNYKGKISDFRLYSVVLSEEDIKTLYNISASIDKNGNMYAYEFKEE